MGGAGDAARKSCVGAGDGALKLRGGTGDGALEWCIGVAGGWGEGDGGRAEPTLSCLRELVVEDPRGRTPSL